MLCLDPHPSQCPQRRPPCPARALTVGEATQKPGHLKRSFKCSSKLTRQVLSKGALISICFWGLSGSQTQLSLLTCWGNQIRFPWFLQPQDKRASKVSTCPSRMVPEEWPSISKLPLRERVPAVSYGYAGSLKALSGIELTAACPYPPAA